ncbi:MAG: TatD family deoxyribonuclease [Promethearchaeota archaeon]|nr:MAG: TatD family deoxyribonuclease [Candidatus Lokiarchaeota archaeon]
MLIDVHCHANLYLAIDHVINDSRAAGVDKVIAVAMSVISQERIISLCKSHDLFYPALGIHPEEVKLNKEIEELIDLVIENILKNKDTICCIGEIGLDHHFIKDQETYPLQLKVFKKMLSIAEKLDLPVNIHSKGAEKEVFETLSSYHIPNVNIHWYSGPENFLMEGIKRGYYFSITPAVKYSPLVRKTTNLVELDQLLFESDGPVKYSGQVGTPSMIKDVLKEVAKIKQIPIDDLEAKIYNNTKNIFPKIF